MSAPGRIRPIRRIVTGHDAAGRSTILQDGPSPHAMNMAGIDHFGVTDLWKTFGAPADLESAKDPCGSPISLAPPRNGTVLRVVEFPPDAAYLKSWDRHQAFASLGVSGADAIDSSSTRHEGMHRTQTVDYAIVISGEIWAVLDTAEVAMRAGDVLVQRGTNHSWSNRSDTPALVAFVLIDAAPSSSGPKGG
jgi:hypothetical protein